MSRPRSGVARLQIGCASAIYTPEQLIGTTDVNLLWNWLLDRRFLNPVLSFIILLTCAFVTYDFKALQQRYPGWSGLLGFAPSALFGALLFCAFCQLFLSIGHSYREKKLACLRSELATAQLQISEVGNTIRQFFDGILLSFSQKLDLMQNDQVRISIYVHDDRQGSFIPCGRYSPNPRLMSPGRTYYPTGQGCIGKGWDHGWHFDNEIPLDRQARRRYEKESYGLPKAVVDGLKMQSRLYAVKRITEGNGKHLGVVVVEALDAARFQQVPLQSILDENNDMFARMIRSFREYIPNPSIAEDSGL